MHDFAREHFKRRERERERERRAEQLDVHFQAVVIEAMVLVMEHA